MALLVSLPRDILHLILSRLSLADVGSLSRSCRALRYTRCFLTSIDLPEYLLAVRPNPVVVKTPSYACMSNTVKRCFFAGTEANFGFCSSCIKIHTDKELRERSRAAWLAKKQVEDELHKRARIAFFELWWSSLTLFRSIDKGRT